MATSVARQPTMLSTGAGKLPAKPASPDHERAAKLVHAIQEAKQLLDGSLGLHDLVSLYEHVRVLEEALAEARRDQDALVKKLADLVGQKDAETRARHEVQADVEKLHGEKAALQEQLAAEKKAFREELAAAQEALKIEEAMAASLREDLKAEREELEDLGCYAIEQEPLKGIEGSIKERLNDIFALAAKLAAAHFGIDLPERTLSDDGLWRPFQRHEGVKNTIPFPMKNTSIAKQMRVGAFLSVLAHELWQHIFRPSWLVSNDSPLNQVLDVMLETDPDHEAYVRAVLYRLDLSYGKMVSDPEAQRAETVKANVINTVLHLVPEDLQDGFRSQLHALCIKACAHWRFVQMLDSRIGRVHHPELDRFHARPLSISAIAGGGSSSSTTTTTTTSISTNSNNATTNSAKPRANGTTQPPGQTNKQQPPSSPASSAAEPNTAATTTPSSRPDPVLIWPGFYNISTGRYLAQDLLVHGYKLMPEHLAAAKAEERAARRASLALAPSTSATPPPPPPTAAAAAAAATGPHREKRGRKRTGSISQAGKAGGVLASFLGGGDAGVEGAGSGAAGDRERGANPSTTGSGSGASGNGKGKVKGNGSEHGGGGSGSGTGTTTTATAAAAATGKGAAVVANGSGSGSGSGSGRKGA
ncbi:hypothetical protein VTJ83DRAFT_6897 [Remersonia thermophila]|uniref:Uncharacterized protein n=1 Tax=Remersonia thermophila TaxID=72144 RepID=A0ABR4D691_9PEZI